MCMFVISTYVICIKNNYYNFGYDNMICFVKIGIRKKFRYCNIMLLPGRKCNVHNGRTKCSFSVVIVSNRFVCNFYGIEVTK